MRSRIPVPAAFAAALILVACNSVGTQIAVPVSPTGAATPFERQPSARALCGVQSLRAHCDALIRTDVGGSVRPDTSAYGPSDIQAAYRLPSATGGSGQTVAIVDAYDDPNTEADLGAYRSHYGLSACTFGNGCLRKLNQSGNQGPYPAPSGAWAAEISLDLDMVSAACPNCRILLVEANSNGFADLAAAEDVASAKGGNVISNSFGGGNGFGPYASHFNHPGHMITASAGDNGYGVETPAAFGIVVSVGGTTLVRGGGNRGWTEIVWSGTGSGCATGISKPAWQHDNGCSSRTMNDVAAVADPNTGVAVYDSYGQPPGFYVMGGTSVSSPLIAAAYALAGNESTLSGGQSLYAKASSLYDVTGGNDGRCSPQYLCTAATGYDGPSAYGTPNGVGAF